ncbi:MAG: NAD(P)/FAD-dependent oxidoreductase [Saprospiraceae bacterium]
MRIVILGNGIAGITAARHIRKGCDHEIIVVSAESDFFFSRTALMYVYMGHMRLQDIKPYEDWFWDKNRIQRVNGLVTNIDYASKTLFFNDDTTLAYDKLILATGSKPIKAGWPGQDLDGVHGLYSLQDLEAMERHSEGLKHAVIVGGGLIGIEMAEMFCSRNIPVTFLVRESSYWNNVLPPEESAMVTRHILEHGVDLRLDTELKEIWGDRTGKLKLIVTNKSEKIECGYVGLTIGVRPNIDFLHFTPIEYDKGILVNDFLETSMPDVWAAGDCAQLRNPQPGRRPTEALWYTARAMGEIVAQNVLASISSPFTLHPSPYQPTLWFNSAKFFDIEYQVYGDIRPGLPGDQATLYWEHPKGKKSIRINYDKMHGHVLGFNLMGIRYRQEVCEKWIREKVHIEEVLPQLRLANFDPEFSREYEGRLIALYNQQNGTNLSLRAKRGLTKFF